MGRSLISVLDPAVWSPSLAEEGAKVVAPAPPTMPWDIAIGDLAESGPAVGAIA
jgi:hypothetical protein